MAVTGIPFTKMHGLGNDFVVIDNTKNTVNIDSLVSAKIADRHLGVGCDQILIIELSTEADFFCRILNSDGSEAEQCGNGLRCVARYLHETELVTVKQFSIATIAGIFPINITDYDNISVTIPAPDLVARSLDIELTDSADAISGDSLSIGNPHFIISVDHTDEGIARHLGSVLTNHDDFPEGVNVGFVETVNQYHIRLRTYERGSGLTNACGSNACAAVAAGVLNGKLNSQVDVEFKYGKLNIEWHGKGQPIVMSGPASVIFRGEFNPR